MSLFNLILFIACLYFPSYLLSLFLLLRLIVIFLLAVIVLLRLTHHIYARSRKKHTEETHKGNYLEYKTLICRKKSAEPTRPAAARQPTPFSRPSAELWLLEVREDPVNQIQH